MPALTTKYRKAGAEACLRWSVKVANADVQRTSVVPEGETTPVVSRDDVLATAPRRWAVKVANADVQRTSVVPERETAPVVSRDDFLAARISLMRHAEFAVPGVYSLTTKTAESLASLDSPRPQLDAPPGLTPPPGLEHVVPIRLEEPQQQAAPVKKDLASNPAPELERFKVLLSNMPNAILKECMLRVVLEQAQLPDVLEMKFRAEVGKVLVTFASYSSVVCCINNFHGRQWDNSHAPVQALYVRTVTRPVRQDQPPSKLSVEAVPFVPSAERYAAHKLSAGAPAFVPAKSILPKSSGSDGSTKGSASDAASSDTSDSEPTLCT